MVELLFNVMLRQVRAKAWKTEVQKASKVMSMLKSTCNSFLSFTPKMEKDTDILNEAQRTGFAEAAKLIGDLKKSAWLVIVFFVFARACKCFFATLSLFFFTMFKRNLRRYDAGECPGTSHG